VTRIEPDGTMRRRAVDTARQDDGSRWEDLAARALEYPPPYRPVPGTAVYHVSVDLHRVQAGEYDLDGPLRDLVTVVLAIGDEVLPAGCQVRSRPWRPSAIERNSGSAKAVRLPYTLLIFS